MKKVIFSVAIFATAVIFNSCEKCDVKPPVRTDTMPTMAVVKVTIALSAQNAPPQIIQTSNTSPTNGVKMLVFTQKVTGISATNQKIPIRIYSNGANLSKVINKISLYRDNNLLDNLDVSAGLKIGPTGITTALSIDSTAAGYIFSPANTVQKDSTATYSIVLDLKPAAGNYPDNTGLTVGVFNADILSKNFIVINNQNGDVIDSTKRSGSAVGQLQTLRVKGVRVVIGTPTVTTTTASNGDITQVQWSIPIAVTSSGMTFYMGQTTQMASKATGSNSFAFMFNNSIAPTVDTSAGSSAVLTSINAVSVGNSYRLDEGATKNFTLLVVLTTPPVNNSFYRAALKQVRFFEDSNLLTNPTNLDLVSVQTQFQFINN